MESGVLILAFFIQTIWSIPNFKSLGRNRISYAYEKFNHNQN